MMLMNGVIAKGGKANRCIVEGRFFCVTCQIDLRGAGLLVLIEHEDHDIVKGPKCENEDCNNIVDLDNHQCLCAGYMDCTVGERWCSCCNKCRSDCHIGSLNEIEEDETT